MAKIYQIVKAFLASADMVYVWLSFVLTVIFADIFKLMDTADKWQIGIVAGVIAFIVGVLVDSLDGFFGTRQYDKTGVRGNEFNPKDLLRDAIGCVLGIIAVLILVL